MPPERGLRLRHLFACFLALLLALCPSLPALARDTISIGMQLEPTALDPTGTAASTAGEITYCNVFEGLTVLDGQGRLSPRLATRWSLSADGLRYEFTLRPGVRFHDGHPFNAQVAAFALERIRKPDSQNPQKPWFEKIRRIEASDDDTLIIHLTQPDSLLPFALALPAAVMVHPASSAGNATHPIGTGPFRFVSWTPTHSVQLERNANYWGRRPALRYAQFRFMHTTAETENLLAEGRVDGLSAVTKVTDHFLFRPDYQIRTRRVEGKMILAINNGHPPFNDLRVRRALAHAIDREKLSRIYGPQLKAELIGSHFAPNHPAYVNLVNAYPHDPARARSLLAQAKVAKGHRVVLKVPPTDYGRFGGLQIAADLEAIGLRVDLVEVDWPHWMTDVFQNKDYELTLILHVEPLDINIYARDDYYFNYRNAAFKDIWAKVLAARTPKEQNRLLADAQRRITEDAVNVFLFMRPERNFMHKNLAGLWQNSPIPATVLEDVYWTK